MTNSKNINAVLFEPDPDLRSAVRGMLREHGITSIIETDRLERLEGALKSGEIDLALLDTLIDDEAACGMMGDVRNDRLGDNPFPVAIGLAADADHQHIRNVVNAGFDSVLLKPFNLGKLKNQVGFFKRERKPFVATAEYVGPDRRNGAREDATSARHIVVPNPVRLINDGFSRESVLSQIQNARAELAEEKVERDLSGIGWIADKICRTHLLGVQNPATEELFNHLERMSGDIVHRVPQTIYAPAIEECQALAKLVEQIIAGGESPKCADIEKLPHAVKKAKAAIDMATTTDIDVCRLEPVCSA